VNITLIKTRVYAPCLIIILASVLLYHSTFRYSLAGDDYCVLQRAGNSGPWWSLWIGRDTLRDMLKVHGWTDNVLVYGSDVFRPGLIWYHKFARLIFSENEVGFRALKLLSMTIFCVAGAMFLAGYFGAGGNGFVICLCGLFLLLCNPNRALMRRTFTEGISYLSGALILCALYMHMRSGEKDASGRDVAPICGLFALALCFRENGIGFAGMAILVDWAAGRSFRKQSRSYIAYSGVTIIYLAIRWLYYGGSFGSYGTASLGEMIGTRNGISALVEKAPSIIYHEIPRECLFPGTSVAQYVIAGALLVITLLIQIIYSRQDFVAGFRKPGALAGCAILALGPGWLVRVDSLYCLLPAVFMIGLLLEAADLRRIAAQPARLKSASAWCLLLPLIISVSLMAGNWIKLDIKERRPEKAELLRQEFRRLVQSLDRKSQAPWAVVFLALPCDWEYDLFDNVPEPAVPMLTDGRGFGKAVVLYHWKAITSDVQVNCWKSNELWRPGEKCYSIAPLGEYEPYFPQVAGVRLPFSNVAFKVLNIAGPPVSVDISLDADWFGSFREVHVVYHDGRAFRELDHLRPALKDAEPR